MTYDIQCDWDKQYHEIRKRKQVFLYAHNFDGWFYLGINPEHFCCLYDRPEAQFSYFGYLHPVRQGIRNLLI